MDLEACVSNLNTVLTISSSSFRPQFERFSLPLINVSFRPRKKLHHQQRLCCVKLEASTDAELERKLVAELNPDWMMEFGKLQDKCCNERRGMVQVMECLEKEAIMGEDEGREPTDYHRRAQIFDNSSRVFQTLKEHELTTADPF